jgi:hypothetical protein
MSYRLRRRMLAEQIRERLWDADGELRRMADEVMTVAAAVAGGARIAPESVDALDKALVKLRDAVVALRGNGDKAKRRSTEGTDGHGGSVPPGREEIEGRAR